MTDVALVRIANVQICGRDCQRWLGSWYGSDPGSGWVVCGPQPVLGQSSHERELDQRSAAQVTILRSAFLCSRHISSTHRNVCCLLPDSDVSGDIPTGSKPVGAASSSQGLLFLVKVPHPAVISISNTCMCPLKTNRSRCRRVFFGYSENGSPCGR